jgi:hypothetical protein
MTAAQFIALLVARFPAIAAKVRRHRHQIYNQMSVFSDHTQQAIDRRDFSTVVRSFRLADEVLSRAPTRRDLITALYVSYLEDIDLSGPCEIQFKSLMTPKVLNGYLEMNNPRHKCRSRQARASMKGVYLKFLERFRKQWPETA